MSDNVSSSLRDALAAPPALWPEFLRMSRDGRPYMRYDALRLLQTGPLFLVEYMWKGTPLFSRISNIKTGLVASITISPLDGRLWMKPQPGMDSGLLDGQATKG